MGYVQDQIITFVREYIDNITDKLKYDRTELGKIISIDKKEVVVSVNEQEVICRVKDGISISVGDIVIIKVPNNNANKKYIDGKLAK